MTKLVNKSDGPKAIPTDKGVVVLQPGDKGDYNVPEADLAAINAAGLLDASETGGPPSLAEMQKEIASGATPATLNAAPAADDAAAADADAGKGGKADKPKGE
jgi:hypothetical protein